jgi:hypothetical protein
MLRELASVNSLLCSSITRQIKYRRKNIGRLSATSIETIFSGITFLNGDKVRGK